MVISKKNNKKKLRKYVIFSMNYMASNYICERINNIGKKFGNLSDFTKPKGDISTYLNSIEKSNERSGGFFGQKLNLPQIKKLSQNELQKIILFFDFIILSISGFIIK